jgi:hypothetical protein
MSCVVYSFQITAQVITKKSPVLSGAGLFIADSLSFHLCSICLTPFTLALKPVTSTSIVFTMPLLTVFTTNCGSTKRSQPVSSSALYNAAFFNLVTLSTPGLGMGSSPNNLVDAPCEYPSARVLGLDVKMPRTQVCEALPFTRCEVSTSIFASSVAPTLIAIGFICALRFTEVHPVDKSKPRQAAVIAKYFVMIFM